MKTVPFEQVRVKDVMTPAPICVTGPTDLQELASIFEDNGISGAPVLDTQNQVVGVVSKTDLITRCLEHTAGVAAGDTLSVFSGLAAGTGSSLDPESLGSVQDFMTTDPVTATADEAVVEVARRMAAERVHRVVVVDDRQRAIGIVTTLDVLDAVPACVTSETE